MAYAVAESATAGHPTLTLSSPGDEATVSFVPSVGMVGSSFRHHGEEILGMRGGLEAYAADGSTFGIPFLHPWANRLDGLRYVSGGHEVVLDAAVSPLRLDANGLPIHGLLAASPYWEVERADAGDDRATLTARLDFGAHDELLAAFPFPHLVVIEATLKSGRLAIVTTVEATGDDPVPISFGFHPYLALPAGDRNAIDINLPVRSRAVLDERGIPTGKLTTERPKNRALADRVLDNLYPEVSVPSDFTMEGGGRMVSVRFERGYPVAQVYAPVDEPYICFEPMTAPTNALVTGKRLAVVRPGDRFTAEFSISVAPAG